MNIYGTELELSHISALLLALAVIVGGSGALALLGVFGLRASGLSS